MKVRHKGYLIVLDLCDVMSKLTFRIVEPIDCELGAHKTCRLYPVCTCEGGKRGICKRCISKLNSEKCPYCNKVMSGYVDKNMVDELIRRRESYVTECNDHATEELLRSLGVDRIQGVPQHIQVLQQLIEQLSHGSLRIRFM